MELYELIEGKEYTSEHTDHVRSSLKHETEVENNCRELAPDRGINYQKTKGQAAKAAEVVQKKQITLLLR